MAKNGWPHCAILLWMMASWSLLARAEDAGVTAQPISMAPSMTWDGMDGPWSSFSMSVGSPLQDLRFLPASDQSVSFLVVPEDCVNSTLGSQCLNSHGGIFYRNESSSWLRKGMFGLNANLVQRIGGTGNGMYGFDNVGLGLAHSNATVVKNQTVAGIATPSFWISTLGLDARPINFTDQQEISSLVATLQDPRQQRPPIPSRSWSYTAGAHNLAPQRFGSLILGGYDTSRFAPNNVTFPFGDDDVQLLQMVVQDVTTNVTNESLLDTHIVVYITSLIADMWLPLSACTKFERAFGLVWDNATRMYLLDDDKHNALLLQNPEVTFRVGPGYNESSVNITMPYWNFHQTATDTLTRNGSRRYFPLKRAANETQYLFGRTFLQSAYLSVDYERRRFNVSQALYPLTSAGSNIVPIDMPTIQGASVNSKGKEGGVLWFKAATAGVVVGSVVLLVVLGLITYWLLQRRAKPHTVDEKLDHIDSDNRSILKFEVPGEGVTYELGSGLTHEVEGDFEHVNELRGQAIFMKSVEADDARETVYELPVRSSRAMSASSRAQPE